MHDVEGGDGGIAIVAVAHGEAELDGIAGFGLFGIGGQFQSVTRRDAFAAGGTIQNGEREFGGDARLDGEAEAEIAAVGEGGMNAVIAGRAFGVGGFGEAGHARHGGHVDDGFGGGADECRVAGERVGPRGVFDAELDLHFLLGAESIGREA